MRKGLRECPSNSLRPLVLLLALLVAAKASADSVRLGIFVAEQTIRSQIELYRVQHYDELPWAPGEVAQKQWAPLVDEKYLQVAPRNRYVSEEVATTIVELTEPGDVGANIDRATAGWAWNSTDEILYAIGVPQSLGCAVAQWEFAQEREDRIWSLLMKAFAGVIVLAAFLYAARPFVRRVIGKEA